MEDARLSAALQAMNKGPTRMSRRQSTKIPESDTEEGINKVDNDPSQSAPSRPQRRAHAAAMANKLWLVDRPAGRKRASSSTTAQEASNTSKRVRQDEFNEPQLVPDPQARHLPPRLSAKVKRAVPQPPPIDTVSDEDDRDHPPSRATRQIGGITTSKFSSVADVGKQDGQRNLKHSADDERESSPETHTESDRSRGEDLSSDDDMLQHAEGNTQLLQQLLEAEQPTWVTTDNARKASNAKNVPRLSSSRISSSAGSSTSGLGLADCEHNELECNFSDEEQDVPANPMNGRQRKAPVINSKPQNQVSAALEAGRTKTSKQQLGAHRGLTNPKPSLSASARRALEEPVWMEDSGKQLENVEMKSLKSNAKAEQQLRVSHEKKSMATRTALAIHEVSDIAHANDSENAIDIIYPSKGGLIHLTSQVPRLREVIRLAIQKCYIDICFDDAFPRALKLRVACAALITAARQLGHSDIERRLTNDSQYINDIAALPSHRVTIFRSGLKVKTDALVDGHYGCCKPGQGETVQWLLANLRYIYPLDLHAKSVVRTKPYQHSGIVAALRQGFFTGNSSFGTKFEQLFVSSIDERPDEPEIPMPMCALAATAVYASLSDWATGSLKRTDFERERMLDVYNENLLILRKIKTDRCKQYHTLMHKLYREARGNESQSHISKTSGVWSRLARQTSSDRQTASDKGTIFRSLHY